MDELSARIDRLSPDRAALFDALLADAVGPAPSGVFAPRAVPIRAARGGPTLVFVHGAGGRVLFLHALARALPAHIGLIGLEAAVAPPGDPVAPGDAIDRYCGALRAVQPTGPCHLAGYSAGGLIAFAMAQRLEAAGEQVASLILVDPIALPGTGPRPPRTGLAARLERARLAGVTPLNPEFPMIERIGHELAAIADGFRAEPVAAPLTILRATRGGDALSPDGLAAWSRLSDHVVSTPIEADHFSIVRDPAIATVAAHILPRIADDDARR